MSDKPLAKQLKEASDKLSEAIDKLQLTVEEIGGQRETLRRLAERMQRGHCNENSG